MKTKTPIPAQAFAISALTALIFMANSIFIPLMDKLVRKPFDLNIHQSTNFSSVNIFAALLFSLPFGFVSDRLKRRIPLISLCLVGIGIMMIGIPHIPKYNLLLVYRFVMGIFEAGASVLLLAWALDISDESNRGRVMGIVTLGIPVGYVTSPLMAGVLGDYSLSLLFALIGGMLIFGGLCLIPLLNQKERIFTGKPSIRESIRVIVDSPRILAPIAFSMVDKFTFAAFVMISMVMRDLYQVESVRTISYITTPFWISFIVFSWPVGIYCDRKGSIAPLLLGSVLYGAMMMVMTYLNLTGFAIMFSMLGACTAMMYVGSVSLLAKYCKPETRGAVMGVYNFLGTVGILLGFIVLGIMADRSLHLSYVVAGLMAILSAVIGGVVFWLWKPDRSVMAKSGLIAPPEAPAGESP